MNAQSADHDALRRERDDAVGGYRVAAESADRFRDVLAEALGYEDENPGDDALIRDLRARFGKTGPEPTRWRDFCTGARAVVDQINAASRDIPPASPDGCVVTPPACHTCKRSLAMDESAWASDWTVITPDGPRLETRYACDDCEAKR